MPRELEAQICGYTPAHCISEVPSLADCSSRLTVRPFFQICLQLQIMALLGLDYASSDEESPLPEKERQQVSANTVVAAPEVSLDVWSYHFQHYNYHSNIVQDPMRLQMMLAKPTDTSLTYNVPYADLARLPQGPTNPFKTTEGNALKRKNVLTGYAEEAAISDATFTSQHRTFQSRGYAQEPNATGALVGDLDSALRYGGRDVVQMKSSRAKRQRQTKGDPSIVDGEGRYLGPWAKYQEEAQYDDDAALAEEELASDEEYIDESVAPVNMAPMNKAATDYQDDLSNQEMTEFHGASLVDYQGRSYMHAPRDIDIDLYKEQGLERTFHPKYVPFLFFCFNTHHSRGTNWQPGSSYIPGSMVQNLSMLFDSFLRQIIFSCLLLQMRKSRFSTFTATASFFELTVAIQNLFRTLISTLMALNLSVAHTIAL